MQPLGATENYIPVSKKILSSNHHEIIDDKPRFEASNAQQRALCRVSSSAFYAVSCCFSSKQKFGCGIVDSTVASDTRRLMFESTHQELVLNLNLLLNFYRIDEK